MLTLFFSFIVAMFTGEWYSYDFFEMTYVIKEPVSKLVEIATSLFNNVDSAVTNVDGLMTIFRGAPYFVYLISAIIASIVSIGIIIVAIKGIKKAFGIFFMGLR